jgi:diguanylate cyclase (GGDEF)-like protein/PAS domain S-box-containing protein
MPAEPVLPPDDHAMTLFELVSSAEQCHAVYGELLVAVVLWNSVGQLAYANPAAEALFGAPLARLSGRDVDAVLHPEADNQPRQDDSARPDPLNTLNGPIRLRCAAGTFRWLLARTVPIYTSTGEAVWLLSSIVDQSEAQETSKALEFERDLLRTLVDTMPDHIYVKDRDSRFIMTNKAHAAHFGLRDPADQLGKTDFDFYDFDVAQALRAEELRIMESGQPQVGAVEDQSALAGRPYWLQSTKVPIVRDGQVIGMMGISRDITELKLVQEHLSHQALHDPLTGLPNRALLYDRLDQVLRVSQREQLPFALCLLDLDRFKEVNDTLGHQRGDRLLQEVATRVHGALRDSDTVARLGGDEFAILLPGAGVEGAVTVATRIRHAFEAPLDLDGHFPDIVGSIGIALFPLHAPDGTALMACADIAMYAAKQAGGGYALFDPGRVEHSADHLALPRELRQALASDGLFLEYQPLVDLLSGQVIAAEALLRWSHPRHGIVPPGRFVPIAERIGILDALTRWVLDAALRQCRLWGQGGLPLRVAVNVAPSTLRQPDLPAQVATALATHDVPASSLTLEITEAALLADPEQALKILAELGEMGVRISIDDFGTGFSSLAYLKHLPVHEIKIDKSFVLGMQPGKRDEAIVRSVIELSHNLGFAVVAEGIEDQATLSRLAELSCDSGQGFFMSHPVSAAALEQWVRASAQNQDPAPDDSPPTP